MSEKPRPKQDKNPFEEGSETEEELDIEKVKERHIKMRTIIKLAGKFCDIVPEARTCIDFSYEGLTFRISNTIRYNRAHKRDKVCSIFIPAREGCPKWDYWKLWKGKTSNPEALKDYGFVPVYTFAPPYDKINEESEQTVFCGWECKFHIREINEEEEQIADKKK